MRLSSDGSLDKGFGRGGLLRFGSSAASEGVKDRFFTAANFAVDQRGRVLVFGSQIDRNHTVFGQSVILPELPEQNAVVLRLDRHGRRDPSFGEGKGFVRSGFGLPSVYSTEIPLVDAMSGAVDSRGRPILLAGVSKPFSGCYGHSAPATQPQAVVRLTQSGRLDPSFGEHGVSVTEGSADFPELEISQNDDIAVSVGRVGGSSAGCRSRSGTTLYQVGSDGQPVVGFGSGGARFVPHLGLRVFEPSRAAIIGGGPGRTLILSKLLPDGHRDNTFGTRGVAKVPPLIPAAGQVTPVAVDARGRILLVGFAEPSRGRRGQRPGGSALLVARLLADGRLDHTFGNSGWIITRFPRGLEVSSTQGTLDDQGRLVVAGATDLSHRSYGGFVVARYLLGPK